jgi:hypothetical protein
MIKNFSLSSFVFGLMCGIVLIGVWSLAGRDPLHFPALSVPEAPLTHDAQAASDNSIAVVDDQAAGLQVEIESVTVPPPGVWAAVREMDGSDLGNVLGAVRVKGPQTQVSVPLLRRTEAGASYAVELYRDNGDDQFDLANDSVYVDFDSGSPAVTYFKTLP